MHWRLFWQEYLLGELIVDDWMAAMEEILAMAEWNAVDSVSTDDVLEALDIGRAEH